MYTFNFTQRKIYNFINYMYSKKSIPLHCQNETRISIKNKTNMKALELKDLKAGKIYKRVDENYFTEYSAYVEVLSEGLQGYCNYVFIMYDEQGKVDYFNVNKNCHLKDIQTIYARYEISNEKEFKQAIETIKNSLTF